MYGTNYLKEISSKMRFGKYSKIGACGVLNKKESGKIATLASVQSVLAPSKSASDLRVLQNVLEMAAAVCCGG